jgi:NAD(P)H-flavin reductase/hemoglobin-like flavoprotein
VGLDDRESLRVLQSILDHDDRSEALMRRFYASWFYLDDSVREFFAPDMAHQRAAFTQALRWLVTEFLAQRAAEPVAFLAQLGRDHRKYGATAAHYDRVCQALFLALRTELGDRWSPAVDDTITEALTLIAGTMSGAAAADPLPAWWDGTVVDHRRVSRDIAVVRLQLDQPMSYHPGQYVSVQVPQRPRRWRYLSPALPPDRQGFMEFHVRTVPGGLISGPVVTDTAPGDRWRLSNPHGGMSVDRDAGDVLMVAGSTGLAPLRALIMDLTRFDENPRVHLFFGGRYPCELYDLPALWELASCNPWLSVSPVSEFYNNPPWAHDYPDPEPPRGLHVRQTGRLPEVVTGYGGWGERQILICGRPDMVLATRSALIAHGSDPARIQHDPLVD